MGPAARSVLKWTVLSVVAGLLGTSLGAAYALGAKPYPEEALTPGVPDDEDGDGRVFPHERDRVAPPAPALVTPPDGAWTTWRPTLAWEAVQDQSNVIYAIQLSADPGFPPETTLTVRNLQGTSWRPDTPLSPLVTYHWRVHALDAGLNEGPWSEARRFTPVLPPLEGDAGPLQAGVEPALVPPDVG